MRATQLSNERREAFGREALEAPALIPSDRRTNRMSRMFGALSNATRRAILRNLTQGDAPAYRIAERFELSLPNIYKHIRVLRSAGLVVEEMRGREKWYAIDRPALDAARMLLGTMIEEALAGPSAERDDLSRGAIG